MLELARERVRTFNHAVADGAPAIGELVRVVKRPNRSIKFYGGNKDLWESREPRVIVAGPAETGKTTVCLHLLDHCAWQYPGMQAAIVRKSYTDMPGSVLASYENKVLHMVNNKTAYGVVKFGGQYPQSYTYPNGSKIWIGGLDNPGKVLSSERDMIVVNQTEELTKDDWETLSTRTTGRAGIMHPARLLGDCNPGPQTHWIKQLESSGSLRLVNTRHEDNPTLFNQLTGDITEQGRVSLAALDALTGVRYKRLRKGLWVSAEGTVYEGIITIDKPYSEIKRHIAGVDWGYKHPGVIQVWGVDSDGRMIRVEEVYQSMKLVAASKPEDAWWINEAVRLQRKYNIESFECDPSEPAYIEAFSQAGINAKKAFNSILPGIQEVESRITVQEDGRPRIALLVGSKGEQDPILKDAHQPTCLEEEIELYSYPKDSAGRANKKEVPVDEFNHGCDAMRYVAAKLGGLGKNYDLYFG